MRAAPTAAQGCAGEALLARFVDAGCEAPEVRALRVHLEICARCRRAVAELSGITRDLGADPVEGVLPDLAPLVMARAELPPARRRWWRQAATGAALAAALCAGLLVERQRATRAGPDEVGFQARGGGDGEAAQADRWVRLRAFSVRDRETPRALAEGAIIRGCQTRLLFAYDNGGALPYEHVTIVGAWPGGGVEWFFPDGDGAAGSVVAAAGTGRELHEEVGLAATATATGAERRLRIWGVFGRGELGRDVVERAVGRWAAHGGAAGGDRLELPGTGQHVIELGVEGCAAR